MRVEVINIQIPEKAFYDLVNEVKILHSKLEKISYEKELPVNLTITEVSRLTRLSKSKIYDLCERGILKPSQHQANGKMSIPRDDIFEFINKNTKR